MLQRIGLFLMTNIAILVVLTVFIYVLWIFGINVSAYGSYGSILIYSAIIWFTGSFISLAISRWIAKKTYQITPVHPDQLSELSEKERVVWNTVEELAQRNHITMPEVWFYQDNEPNAFATGMSKNSSLVAVSSGLLDAMSKDAIEWVVAHEMAHILNGDMVTMTLLQWIVNTFVVFAAKVIANIASGFVKEEMAWMVRIWVDIALQIIFGILASLITMKFSRYREFKADAGAANYVWKEKMIAGLKVLQQLQEKMHEPVDPKFATMQISAKKKWGIMSLFSSHPDLSDRIEALENMIIR